jgi:hypothetical protein
MNGGVIFAVGQADVDILTTRVTPGWRECWSAPQLHEGLRIG